MALIPRWTDNFIELALDGTTSFDSEVDLVTYGLARNAPTGLRVRKITFVPSAAGDQVIVRDGQNGPAVFTALNVLGTYDVLKDEYLEDGHINRGKLMTPYIDAAECTIGIINDAYIIFEL